jgi:hypothetical protein
MDGWMDERGAKGESIHKMPPKDRLPNVLVICTERGGKKTVLTLSPKKKKKSLPLAAQ